MVVRHHQIDFASGALVFPGGRVEAADAVLASGDASLAFRVAAIRETWEECGILLATPGTPPPAEGDFAAMLLERGLKPDCDCLAHFAHWITPIPVPKRFDTHFFLAAAPADQDAVHDGHEAVDSVWIRPADALAEALAGTKKVVFPTRMNLTKLARSNTVAEAFAAARAKPGGPLPPHPDRGRLRWRGIPRRRPAVDVTAPRPPDTGNDKDRLHGFATHALRHLPRPLPPGR